MNKVCLLKRNTSTCLQISSVGWCSRGQNCVFCIMCRLSKDVSRSTGDKLASKSVGG